MILSPTNKRIIRPYDKPSFEHTQRYGLIKGHWANRNRVGLWLFNEGSGNKIFDLSGNGNTGTFVADTHFVPGKFVFAVDFDGTGDYLSIPDSPLLDTWTNFAISFLFKVDQLASNKGNSEYLIFKGDGYGGSDNAYGIWVDDSTNKVQAFYSVDGTFTGAFQHALSNNAVVAGVWYHVIFVKNGAVGTLYVDGIAQSTTASLAGTVHNSAEPVRMGDRTGDGSKNLDGAIDIPSLYNGAFSTSEIAQLCREPFLGIQKEPRITYFFVPTGGVVYQELNLTVTADASAAETDTHAMVDTGKAVQAAASATESDTQQMVDTGKEVSANASVSKTDTQQMVETGKAVEAAASVSCTDLKVVFELNLEVTASGNVIATDAHTMIETGKVVTVIATPAVIDTHAMVETGLGVSADASVSCTDTMGLLAHIAAFMILRQCT